MSVQFFLQQPKTSLTSVFCPPTNAFSLSHTHMHTHTNTRTHTLSVSLSFSLSHSLLFPSINAHFIHNKFSQDFLPAGHWGWWYSASWHIRCRMLELFTCHTIAYQQQLCSESIGCLQVFFLLHNHTQSLGLNFLWALLRSEIASQYLHRGLTTRK